MQVEQIDREAAAKVAVLAEMRELILAGKADHHAEAFARHRHQARAEVVGEIVAWLREENGLCDCAARCSNECACGAWDDWKQWSLERTAKEIEAKFGGRD